MFAANSNTSWLQSAGHVPFVTLGVAAVCALLLSFETAQLLLEYDRTAIASGEWWRLLTGHLTHCDLSHLFWDGAVFVVLGAWLEHENRRSYAALLTISAVVISIGVWQLLPALDTYRGLSGIDTAMFVVVAIGYLRGRLAAGDLRMAGVAGVALVALAAKTLFEAATGATLFVDAQAAGFRPVPMAHLLGAAVGLLLMSLAHLRDKRPPAHAWRPFEISEVEKPAA